MTTEALTSTEKMSQENGCGSTHHEPDTQPLRLLLVAPSLEILGGQAVQAQRLITSLHREPGVQVSLLPINPRLPGLFGQFQKVRYVRTVLTSLAYCHSLSRVRDCDVVHVFSASYFSFLLAPTPAILAARLFRKKVLLNYRSGEAEDHLRRWGRVVLPIIRLTNLIVVPSGFLVEVFARFGVSASPVSNIVDLTSFHFRLRSPLGPVFLSNRNLEPLYNVGCIFRAFAIVQQQFHDARLIVAGDGSERGSLEMLARQLHLRNVEFIGRVPPEQMPVLFDRADLYLNSSSIDNMPTSILEAFAAGTPVVTTDAGGIPWIVEHERTGLLVHRGDHDAMAAQILRLLGNPSLAADLAIRARQECQKYRWSEVRANWMRLYHRLAERPLPSEISAESAT